MKDEHPIFMPDKAPGIGFIRRGGKASAITVLLAKLKTPCGKYGRDSYHMVFLTEEGGIWIREDEQETMLERWVMAGLFRVA